MHFHTIAGRRVAVEGRFIRTARLSSEWLEDLDDPRAFIQQLRTSNIRADFFTFWQRLPELQPKYPFFREKDSVAAVPLVDYDHWWNNQINSKTRNLVRKAEKSGVQIRIVPFDDQLVSGITDIFNETPVRQARRFTHFGKDHAQVKKDMSKELDQSLFLGAFFDGELIGFIKLLDAGNYSMAVEIISKIKHRDKSPQNALLAFAVKVCCERNVSYLVYSRWISGSLGDFKRRNGFEKFELSRYFVPLSLKGRCLLRLNLYPALIGLPQFESMRQWAKTVRRHWYFFSQDGIRGKS
jgi:hypothetical protein